MRTLGYSVLAFTLLGPFVAMAQSEESPTADPLGMWECLQTKEGVPLYTNREHADCRKMELKPISTVPALPEFPPLRRAHPSGLEADVPPQIEPVLPAQRRNIPDWGADWYAKNTSDASVQSEVCSLYSEWLQLSQRTRGGIIFGSDPSYGSDPSGRNFSPSNPFWDNARYLTLANIFGSGFVPIGCL